MSYIELKIIEEKPKTKVYAVVAEYDDTKLGEIYWYGAWRQYVFQASDRIVWSSECLKELDKVLCELNEEYKAPKCKNCGHRIDKKDDGSYEHHIQGEDAKGKYCDEFERDVATGGSKQCACDKPELKEKVKK